MTELQVCHRGTRAFGHYKRKSELFLLVFEQRTRRVVCFTLCQQSGDVLLTLPLPLIPGLAPPQVRQNPLR